MHLWWHIARSTNIVLVVAAVSTPRFVCSCVEQAGEHASVADFDLEAHLVRELVETEAPPHQDTMLSVLCEDLQRSTCSAMRGAHDFPETLERIC